MIVLADVYQIVLLIDFLVAYLMGCENDRTTKQAIAT